MSHSDVGSDPVLDSLADSTRERLRVVTQRTRFVLLMNIIGHPAQLPSLAELEHVNPSKARSTLVEHLEELIETGVVERVEHPPNKAENDIPHVFYGVTAEGRRFLETHRLLEAEKTLQDYYEAVAKPADIARYEAAPRPD